MKRLLAILLFCGALKTAAQDAPQLKLTASPDGLTVTWPVQVLRAGTVDLQASYQIEVAESMNAWRPVGSLLRGESFPNRTATANIRNSAGSPAAFVRVRAALDFSGRSFVQKSMQNASLNNAVFTGADLFFSSLDAASFNNADFSGADLRFATMTDVSATNADFTLARLSDADLSSANLSGSSLLFAELGGAKLVFADLSGADLRGAVLEDADLTFARLHNTRADDLTLFDKRGLAIWLIVNGQGANRTFTNVDLTFTDLSHGNLTNSQLQRLDLSGADLTFADLSGANLNNAILRQLDLRGTIISPSTVIATKWRTIWDIINNAQTNRALANLDLTQGFWIDAMFQGADVRNAKFDLGLMVDPDFSKCNANTARFTTVEFHGANFRNANLTNAQFNNSLLEDVDFTGATITGANFIGATFRNTTMPDGTIRNF